MKNPISILALGDLLLPAEHTPWQPDSYLSAVLAQHDLIVGNLEVPVCSVVDPQPKTYALRSAPSALGYLATLGVDAVSLANNHALDQGAAGLLETVQNLDSRGIAHAGAGRYLAEARSYRRIEVADSTVGFVSAACTLPGLSAATTDRPGIAPIRVTARLALDSRPLESPGRPPEVVCEVDYATAGEVASVLRDAKENCEHVIVALHWGVPMDTGYAPYQEELAKWLVDESGVDLVLGCHPHVLQAVERYKQSIIVYSMGHFIASATQISDFYGRLRGLDIARWDRTAAFSLRWSDKVDHWYTEIWPFELDELGLPREPGADTMRRVVDEIEDLLVASGQKISVSEGRVTVL